MIVKDWFMARSHPHEYEHRLVAEQTEYPKPVVVIRCVADKPGGFGTLMQQCAPDDFVGDRIRFSGDVMSSKVLTDGCMHPSAASHPARGTDRRFPCGARLEGWRKRALVTVDGWGCLAERARRPFGTDCDVAVAQPPRGRQRRLYCSHAHRAEARRQRIAGPPEVAPGDVVV